MSDTGNDDYLDAPMTVREYVEWSTPVEQEPDASPPAADWEPDVQEVAAYTKETRDVAADFRSTAASLGFDPNAPTGTAAGDRYNQLLATAAENGGDIRGAASAIAKADVGDDERVSSWSKAKRGALARLRNDSGHESQWW